ncbi:MAG: hypothetical protein K2Y29_11395 [Beijerinckiaceae bacterium]|nr:hypothetical protein [Beijerinckiaceae bacterium]
MENATKVEVEILGITRQHNPRPNKAGNTILAFFDCAVGPIVLSGCAFLRTPKNGLAVWPPKIEGRAGKIAGVKIADSSSRHQILVKVQEAYRLMGGTDGEWMPSDTYRGPIGRVGDALQL